jgi:hypothetical protein
VRQPGQAWPHGEDIGAGSDLAGRDPVRREQQPDRRGMQRGLRGEGLAGPPAVLGQHEVARVESPQDFEG